MVVHIGGHLSFEWYLRRLRLSTLAQFLDPLSLGVWQGYCRGKKVCRWCFWCRAVIRHPMAEELGGTSHI